MQQIDLWLIEWKDRQDYRQWKMTGQLKLTKIFEQLDKSYLKWGRVNTVWGFLWVYIKSGMRFWTTQLASTVMQSCIVQIHTKLFKLRRKKSIKFWVMFQKILGTILKHTTQDMTFYNTRWNFNARSQIRKLPTLAKKRVNIKTWTR